MEELLIPLVAVGMPIAIVAIVFFTDYRKTQDKNSTLFVGVGLFLFGVFFLGHILKGAGALVAFIGLGLLAAGFLFPDPKEN